MSDIPNNIMSAYGLGEAAHVDVIEEGLIHETYKLETEEGDFVLQKLHPKLATNEIATDFANVTDYLAKQQFPAPKMVRTKHGDVLATDDIGRRWRMQTFIEGETHDVASLSDMVDSAAGMYARFHQVMEDFPHAFVSQRNAHDTQAIYSDVMSTVESHRETTLFSPVERSCEIVENELPDLFLPVDLPKRVIHGDPKISNVRFQDGEAAALLDLDTCTRQTVLVELGDAFRSWCGRTEDDPENIFDVEYFRAGWGGYLKQVDGFLTDRERRLVPQAIATITLELAARFLKDYFEDSYFGWDDESYPSRQAHNLARTKGQIALYLDVKRKMSQLQEVVSA
jgi:Ser/Thr protein kinase RdoA (MazF antagonist)